MNPELPALGNPAEILADGVLAREAAYRTENARLIKWLDVLAVAVPALFRIAATGNVQAKAACIEIQSVIGKK